MLFQQATPDTASYLIVGYGVIFGFIGLFIVSLVSRFRNLQKDMALLDELKKNK